jgi:hypothetical protein
MQCLLTTEITIKANCSRNKNREVMTPISHRAKTEFLKFLTNSLSPVQKLWYRVG